MDKNIDISEFLLNLEKKLNLFEWELDGVYVWELIRVKMYLLLQESTSNESFGEVKKSHFFSRISILFHRITKNVIMRNPFLDRKKREVLIFESGRKYKIDRKFIDIYTWFLTQNLKKHNKRVETYETNFLYDKLSENPSDTKHIDFIKFASKILSFFFKVSFSEKNFQKISEIENAIFENLNIRINLQEMIKTECKVFLSERLLYIKLLQLKKPEQIFIVNYVDYYALIGAAKEQNIEIIELQHGLIIDTALTYHFPNNANNSLHYFPTQFYQWKGFNHNTGKLPLSPDKIVQNEVNHLSYLLQLNENTERLANVVLVVSQPFFSNLLLDFMIKNIRQMPDYLFYYKLHPMEFSTFESKENTKILSSFANVRIIKNEESVYKLLKVSSYVVGIYSTTLFEADMFQCVPVVLDIDHPYTKSLGKNSSTILIDPKEILISAIKTDKIQNI